MQKPLKKMVIAAMGISCIGLGTLFWYWYDQPAVKTSSTLNKIKSPVPPVPYVLSTPEPSNDQTVAEKENGGVPETLFPAPGSPVPLPAMDQSDNWVREMIKNLCLSRTWTEWLKQDHLIRRVTAAIENIASGVSPRPHLGFLKPRRPFSVQNKKGVLVLDPKTYKRYNTVAGIFSSFDAQATVNIYLTLEPLFQQAYRDLGYPDGDFRDTLLKAIERILQTPIVRGEILLIPAEQGINTRFRDEALENLSPAQKHLVRFGPENTRKVQEKLREMALKLGIPGESLPKPEDYTPQIDNPAPLRY